MATETPSLTLDEIRAMITRHLDGPRPLTVRRSQAAGVGYLIGSAFVLAIAGFMLWNMGRNNAGVFIGMGFGLYGATLLLYGLVYTCDRTPQLVLDEKGLTDHTTGVKRVFPWEAIARANLYRTTRNGSEQSATLTIYLNSPILRQKEATINVADLEFTSEWIFREVGRWAKLK